MPAIFEIHARRKQKITDNLTHWVNFLHSTGCV
jgi:hypothetical protein